MFLTFGFDMNRVGHNWVETAGDRTSEVLAAVRFSDVVLAAFHFVLFLSLLLSSSWRKVPRRVSECSDRAQPV